jgi:hypothetical protein
MSPKFFAEILQALIGVGTMLFKRFKGDSAAAIRELVRIDEDGSKFIAAEKAGREKLEALKGKKP